MSQNESSQPLLGEENIDQGNVNIQQMFDFQRFETNLDIFFACLYFPIGICLFIIRLFIFIQVLLISTLLLKDSYARSYIFRSMFFVLGIIVQEEDFNLKNCKAQLVVSNRVSDFDPLVVNLIYPCASHSIIAFPWYINWLFGISRETIAQHRNDLSGRVIIESSVPVLCFPEASQTNGKVGLFKFESWPFASELTSHLIFIKSKNPLFNVSTSPLEASWLANLFWLLFFPVTIFNVRYLASLDKAENETADEYTKRVQLKMASCTNLVASSFDNSDKKEMMKRIQDEHNRRYSHSYRVSSTPSVDDMAIKGKEAMPQVPPDTSKSDTEITENAEELAYYLGRLKLYEEILQKRHGILHKDHFDCNFYNEFRKKSLLELAISFANQADTVALAVLLKRERTTLVNHLLVIISNFPETVSPEEYKDIIDVLFGFYLNSKTDFTSFQPASWSEELTTNFNPAQIESDFCNKFYSEHEKYKSYIIDHYLSEEMLTSWFKDRALEILNFTSLVDNSLQLLEYGMDQNLNVAELYHQLDLYSLLIYESAEQTLSSFKEFEDLSVIDKMNLILRKHDASYAIENLFEKFIEKLSKNANNKVDKKTLLREFMVDLTKTDFKQCLKIFESCSMVDKTLEQAESLKTICDACDLVELAIDCIRAYENPSNLEFAFRIMECLPERSQAALLMGENPSKVRQFNRVNDQADQIEYYLSMLEVLRDYGTNITVKDLEAIVNSKTTTAAQKFFEKVIKNFCSTSFSATADISLEWKNFFWNLQDLRKNCLSALTSEQLVELCVNSLLFSGNKVYIQLALHHISFKNSKTSSKKVAHDKGREMLKKAATDYIKFANPIQDNNLELARICLQAFKENNGENTGGGGDGDDDEIQEELDLINGLNIMYDDFNFDMLPIKVKQHAQPRVDLIESLLKCSKNSYAQVEKVLRLSKLLRVCKADSDERREGIILSMIGKEAVNESDYQAAHQVCQMILQRNLQHGWDLCYLFAKLPYLEDVMTVDQRLDYLSFALAYCPETDIDAHFSILHEIKSIKLAEKNRATFKDNSFIEFRGEQNVR